MLKEIRDLKQDIHELQSKKILDETQLPEEILIANNLLPESPNRLKKGRGHRPLLRSEIEEAKKHCKSEMATAKYMGVSYDTYKKYAKMHGIFDPNPHVKGRRAIFDPDRGK